MIWLSCQGETWKCEMSAWVPCRGLLVSGGLIGFWRCADEAWDFGHNRRDSLLGTVGNGSRKTERCREVGKRALPGVLSSRHSATIRSCRRHVAQFLVSPGP